MKIIKAFVAGMITTVVIEGVLTIYVIKCPLCQDTK